MNILPLIKAELKRCLWLLWLALFSEFFICYGMLKRRLEWYVLDVSRDFSYSSSVVFELDEIILLAVIWTVGFAFFQFNRDELGFKKALPYKNKDLLLGKFFAWAVAAVPSVLFYGLLMVNLSNRFDFIEIAVSWEKNGMAVSHGNAFAALNCFALFVYALALYSYTLLCNSVSKNAVIGCAVASFGFAAFGSGENLAERLGIMAWFGDLTDKIGYMFGERYVLPIVMIVFSAAVIAVCMPLSFILYGGGRSKDPYFGYDGVNVALIVISGIFGAGLVPEIMQTDGSEAVPGAVSGAFLGVLAALAVNGMRKRFFSDEKKEIGPWMRSVLK